MRSVLPLFLALVAGTCGAATISETFTVGTSVPDNSNIGLADYRTISAPGMTAIESLSVTLNITGGWNGDLYAQLVHDSGFVVLLNRPGRSTGNSDGAGSVGMFITLVDDATQDVHTDLAAVGMATGTFQPDARTEDPLLVTDTSFRSAFLSSFTGLDPNGTWALFFADQSPGAVSTLDSWTLAITAIPEPSQALLALVGTLALTVRWRVR
jgi:subtilisin-like proprotein convertase family protein